MLPVEFDNLIEKLTILPGVSKKQAKKIIVFLLLQKKENINNFIDSFLSDFKKVINCEVCGYYSNQKRCIICSSKNREKKLMIVENIEQIEKYENWKLWKGKYFIIPILFNKKFERINEFDFSFFLSYIKLFNEIVISISPTAEGVLTSNLIFDTIKKENYNINVSKLAIGLPMGSLIDYTDQITLSYAINNRKGIK